MFAAPPIPQRGNSVTRKQGNGAGSHGSPVARRSSAPHRGTRTWSAEAAQREFAVTIVYCSNIYMDDQTRVSTNIACRFGQHFEKTLIWGPEGGVKSKGE